jgi:rifampin ADP-ribosylating transferase
LLVSIIENIMFSVIEIRPGAGGKAAVMPRGTRSGRAVQWVAGEPAYHGTSAELRPGDLVEPGHEANFSVSAPGCVYFTDETQYGSAVDCARFAARRKGGHPHVYRVEPTGDVERDPDFAVSGGSFRTRQPLRVAEEDDLWRTDSRWNQPEDWLNQ